MAIDFQPVDNNEIILHEFAQQFSVQDLREATHASIDHILRIIDGLSDTQVTFVPYDPEANDPHASPEEQYVGWTLAHLAVHVTASSEEYATYSSFLARGIPYGPEPRLRYETHWTELTTAAQVIQRLEESRRMRIAYLDAWPDTPHFDVYREITDGYREKFGEQNAKSSFLLGLWHEVGHHAQIAEVARQAREAK